MAYPDFLKIEKPFFSIEDVSYALGVRLTSAAVLCSRYVKKGWLLRLKRGLYVRSDRLKYLDQMDFFRIANFLQVPSYLSLMTALSYYGMTTQIQRGFFESISMKRTKQFEVGQVEFHYVKIRPDLYRGFERSNGVFIALPEKAFLDACYLSSLGRYAFDASSIDLGKMNEERLTGLSMFFPSRARKHMERLIGTIGRS